MKKHQIIILVVVVVFVSVGSFLGYREIKKNEKRTFDSRESETEEYEVKKEYSFKEVVNLILNQ